MQESYFEAQTDLEIGDNVKCLYDGYNPNEKFTVYDIRTIHQLRERIVYFEFKLINKNGEFSKWLRRKHLERIY